MALRAVVPAERENGVPITMMIFDDGWIEHPTVVDRATGVRRAVVVGIVVSVFVGLGLSASFALIGLLDRLGLPIGWQIVIPLCSVVLVMVIGLSYPLPTAVSALLQVRADRQQDRIDPEAAERRFRRKAGVPWFRRARSAAEFASLFENPVGVTSAGLAAIAYHPNPEGPQITAWLRDGTVRSYRSTDPRLAQQMSRFAARPVPGIRAGIPDPNWPRPRRRIWPVVVSFLLVVAAIGAIPASLTLVMAVREYDPRVLTSPADTASPSRGGAARLTAALRAQGYTCSDEGIDPSVVSRICGRATVDQRAYVTFIGSAKSGGLNRAEVSIFPPGDPPGAVADAVSAVADGLAMTPDERTEFLQGTRAGRTDQVRVGRWTYQLISDGYLRVELTGWRMPIENPARLGGNADQVQQLAIAAGYACTRQEWSVSCERDAGGAKYSLEARENVEHTELKRFYLGVSSQHGSQERWLTAMTTILDGLPGSRAAAVAGWLRANPRLAGADAYVAGMKVYVTTDRGDNVSSGDVLSTCWPSRSGPFC